MRAHCLVVVVVAVAALALCACGDKEAEEQPSTPSSASPSTASSSRSTDPASSSPAKATASDDDNISIIKAKTKGGDEAAIGIKAPAGWTVMRAPTTPDPQAGKLTLAEATKGLDKQGTLAIHIDTSMGGIYCDLFEKAAPNTVANFVGLARAKRKFWDADKLEWVARPYYDGTTIHRVMPGFMIQGGDHTGTGNGGIGYSIPDEVKPGERADRPGLLFMATRGAGTGESQFFITTRPAAHIDGKFTKFGECSPVGVVDQISRVPSSGKPAFKPTTPVMVRSVEIRRLAGGRMQWIPKGTDLTIPSPVPVGRAVQVPLGTTTQGSSQP